MPAKEEELTSLICHARLKISTPGGAPKGLCMPVHEPGRSGNATRSWLDNSLDPALGDCSARNTERDGVRKIVTDNVREVKSRMERYLNKVSDNQGRAFTTLSSGWIGFVPEEARKGDEAVVLRGEWFHLFCVRWGRRAHGSS